MRWADAARRTVRNFSGDRTGNFAVATAAVASLLALSIGFGINAVQIATVRSNLSHALDGAVTSTARDLTTGRVAPADARGLVEGFLKSNVDVDLADSSRVVLQDLVVDRTARTVEASAYVDVDLFFPVFQGSGTRRVSADSAALYSDKAIEVVMMLDVTGSMSGQKIRDLKEAASDALEVFLGGQDPGNPRVRVSIVPYADAVNTGSLADAVYVEDRFTTGEPPRLGDPIAVSAAMAIRPDACATERKGSHQFTDAGPYTAMVNRDYRLAFCPSVALRPLTANLSSLKSTVSKFSASGHTGGHTGIQWAWYMLSPKWREVLPQSARPLPHDPRKVAKIAILMTDGEFNTAFAGVPRTGNTRNQPALSRSHAETLCAAMRDDGIEIFTVGFMLNQEGARQVMRDCASPDTRLKHYYETNSGEELKQAFREIAGNVESLALTR